MILSNHFVFLSWCVLGFMGHNQKNPKNFRPMDIYLCEWIKGFFSFLVHVVSLRMCHNGVNILSLEWWRLMDYVKYLMISSCILFASNISASTWNEYMKDTTFHVSVWVKSFKLFFTICILYISFYFLCHTLQCYKIFKFL